MAATKNYPVLIDSTLQPVSNNTRDSYFYKQFQQLFDYSKTTNYSDNLVTIYNKQILGIEANDNIKNYFYTLATLYLLVEIKDEFYNNNAYYTVSGNNLVFNEGTRDYLEERIYDKYNLSCIYNNFICNVKSSSIINKLLTSINMKYTPKNAKDGLDYLDILPDSSSPTITYYTTWFGFVLYSSYSTFLSTFQAATNTEVALEAFLVNETKQSIDSTDLSVEFSNQKGTVSGQYFLYIYRYEQTAISEVYIQGNTINQLGAIELVGNNFYFIDSLGVTNRYNVYKSISPNAIPYGAETGKNITFIR